MGMRRSPAGALAVAVAAALGLGTVPEAPAAARAAGRPSLLFVLLDTTRADRFGAWGNARPTTPQLDALAAQGALFLRHFANAHATRSSMPQLMSGRYYHPDILRPLHSLSHPREYYFLDSDPSAVLLPAVLRDHGYHVSGVSAHPWVVSESDFGRGFHRLDHLAAEPRRGHVDARAVVDRALELWRARPRERPTFLYVHLMDLHMPRWLPDRGLRFAAARWRGRFSPGSKPLFGRDRRRWDQADARDFTGEDRETFTAFYDTLLAHTDAEIGRLLSALRDEDPTLGSVMVVIVADHGEELGEAGRTDHTDSLADGVQHIPLIIAGAGVRPGQRLAGFSENVDVVPTLLRLLDLEDAAAASSFDGRPLVGRDGRLCAPCARGAVHYAWVSYQAVRSRAALLRMAPEVTGDAVCEGERRLWRLHGSARAPETAAVDGARVAKLERHVRGRLGRRARRFDAVPWRRADRSFFVPARFWVLPAGDGLGCPHVGLEARRGDLVGAGGWQYARGSFLVSRRGAGVPLAVSVAAPDGAYDVDVGVVPVGTPPLLFGFARWLRRGFRPEEAAEFVALGRFAATGRRLRVRLPEELGLGRRLVSLRLTPPDAPAAAGETPELDAAPDYRERLRALGYVD
jgi:arylsulfatase A-like enzyme